MNNNQTYLAITGDVIKSSNVQESEFSILKVRLNEFNEKIKPAVPFSIQAGDEIQGLMGNGNHPVESLIWILKELYPMKIRWGIGKGVIDSPLKQSTSEMRGEAFELSRNALIYAKKKKQVFAFMSKEKNDDVINIIFKLLAGYLDTWDKMAFRRYFLYTESKTIYTVAEMENVSPEAINKHMNRRKLKLVYDTAHFLDESHFMESTL